jgi:hypothetical protein
MARPWAATFCLAKSRKDTVLSRIRSPRASHPMPAASRAALVNGFLV